MIHHDNAEQSGTRRHKITEAGPLTKKARHKKAKRQKLPTMAKPLGKAVKVLRGRLRLNQTDLAARVPDRLSQGYVSRVEKGLCFPRDDRLSAIVEALGCTHGELWKMAETLASIDLDGTGKDDVLQCIGHESLGRSYEEVKSIYVALDDDIVVELDSFNRLLANGKKLQQSQLARIDHLRERADSLPENTDTLREYINGILDLLMTACKEHAVSVSS